MAFSLSSAPRISCSGRDEVYVAAVPLRATKGPAQLLMSTAYSLNFRDLQHFMVIIKPSSSSDQALVYDFQPRDPENVWVAVTALSGRKVSDGPERLRRSWVHVECLVNPISFRTTGHPWGLQGCERQSFDVQISGLIDMGVILVRKMGKLPKRKCWFVGHSKENAVDAALKFNENWDTDLRIGHHDCRNYSQGLVEYLTGEKAVLEHLRERSYTI